MSGPRLLWEPETGRRWLVTPDDGGPRKIKGLGVFDSGRLTGLGAGAIIDVAGHRLVVLDPTPADLHATVRRKAQIITAKDASRIVYELGIRAGHRVFESGIGSGAATLVLAEAVGRAGRVIVQELREDFAQWAGDNLRDAELADRVELHLGDLTQAVADGVRAAAQERGFDAVLLDQPDAAAGFTNLAGLLAPGCTVAAYCPQVSQAEAAARAFEAGGLQGVRMLELMEREWQVKDHGSRPAFDGLGHTGFLVFGRWPGKAWHDGQALR